MSSSGLRQAISCPRLFDGEQWLSDHAVVIAAGQIEAVLPESELPQDMPLAQRLSGTLAPGFIDLQVNGGGGVMLNNAPTAATVKTMVDGHRKTGTTGMLPTVISDTRNHQQLAVQAVREARDAGNHSVLGIHIEGPFFELARRGTHKAELIRQPQDSDIDWLCSLGALPVILTLAPEHFRSDQLRRMSEAGLMLCAGHTNARYEDICRGAANGLRGVTHLFNAMSPLLGREPGTTGAALALDALWAGVIADGHHVHPATIALAHKAKPAGKLFLVTDAMATVGADEDSFEIYGERIAVKGGCLVNAEGALAGSAIGMIDAVRISHQDVGLPLAECLRMAALYPAQFLQQDAQLGRIKPGYRADLVHFSQAFKVVDTWVAGQHQSHL